MVSQSTLNDLPFPVLGFAARSGTGKTTLLKKLIPLLKAKNYRLGLIKHTHHNITFDNRGLTKRVFEKGFDVIATSPDISLAEWHHKNPGNSLAEGIATFKHLPIDLLLIEGFKQASFPKIELHRETINAPLLLNNDPHIIAIASDNPRMLKQVDRPVLDLNHPEKLTDWVETTILLPFYQQSNK